MIMEFDREANALYLRLRSGTVARTVELTDDVYLDVDDNGEVIGAEFVQADDLFLLLARSDGQLHIPERIPA